MKPSLRVSEAPKQSHSRHCEEPEILRRATKQSKVISQIASLVQPLTEGLDSPV